jgi:hypothetical protein
MGFCRGRQFAIGPHFGTITVGVTSDEVSEIGVQLERLARIVVIDPSLAFDIPLLEPRLESAAVFLADIPTEFVRLREESGENVGETSELGFPRTSAVADDGTSGRFRKPMSGLDPDGRLLLQIAHKALEFREEHPESGMPLAGLIFARFDEDDFLPLLGTDVRVLGVHLGDPGVPLEILSVHHPRPPTVSDMHIDLAGELGECESIVQITGQRPDEHFRVRFEIWDVSDKLFKEPLLCCFFFHAL